MDRVLVITDVQKLKDIEIYSFEVLSNVPPWLTKKPMYICPEWNPEMWKETNSLDPPYVCGIIPVLLNWIDDRYKWGFAYERKYLDHYYMVYCRPNEDMKAIYRRTSDLGLDAISPLTRKPEEMLRELFSLILILHHKLEREGFSFKRTIDEIREQFEAYPL